MPDPACADGGELLSHVSEGAGFLGAPGRHCCRVDNTRGRREVARSAFARVPVGREAKSATVVHRFSGRHAYASAIGVAPPSGKDGGCSQHAPPLRRGSISDRWPRALVVPVTAKCWRRETRCPAYRQMRQTARHFRLESAGERSVGLRWSFIGAGVPSALTGVAPGGCGTVPPTRPTGRDPLKALHETWSCGHGRAARSAHTVRRHGRILR